MNKDSSTKGINTVINPSKIQVPKHAIDNSNNSALNGQIGNNSQNSINKEVFNDKFKFQIMNPNTDNMKNSINESKQSISNKI